MWQHNYDPLGNPLLSTLVAALPIFVLLLLIGILRKPAWMSALAGLATGLVVATLAYGMPAKLAASSALMGAAFGLLPIGWIVYWAVVLYRITQETGNFEIIKDSIGGLTTDRRLQAMLIAFAFGAFVEGAAGFGTPVAVAAAMLTGLGFSPFFAAGICLLANTAPVAFGSIGIPVTTLANTTGLPEAELSAWVGRICAPISVFIPAYLVMVMGGLRGLKGVLPAAIVCGVCFAGVQVTISGGLGPVPWLAAFIGPRLVDILAALTAIIGLVLLLKVWQPKDHFVLAGEHAAVAVPKQYPLGRTLLAWSPYLLLVAFVLVWGYPDTKTILAKASIPVPWPGLHNAITRMPPAVAAPAPYGAVYDFQWLVAAGTACAFSTIASALVLRVSVGQYLGILGRVFKQLAFSLLTIAAVLGLAYVMNYSGAVVTLGLAFAATGALFPFFSALVGWLGVFLTGSDTSANALFGNLQVVTANSLGFNPAVMAASNSAGGVMGKMISLTSLAVAVAATGMARSEEGKLFRFTVKHSVFLAATLGVIASIYAYAER
ncbi:MAG TPA: lactate permease LctP family transporter [Gammaproteobacteria bacterium]